jgi:hypothetical protein
MNDERARVMNDERAHVMNDERARVMNARLTNEARLQDWELGTRITNQLFSPCASALDPPLGSILLVNPLSARLLSFCADL